MKKQHIQLTDSDKIKLKSLLGKGTQPVRVTKRAIALLALDEGKTLMEAGNLVSMTNITVSHWRDRYKEGGLPLALYDKPRPGRPIEISGVERARITALSTSDAPAGYARWTMRLLADKAVELDYCEHVSHTSVANILKKTNLSPT